MSPAVAEASGKFERAKSRLLKLLEKTPEDRVNWSPAPTARTPVELVAHAGLSIHSIHNSLMGESMNFTSTDDFDAKAREFEKGYTSRDEVVEYFTGTCTAYETWLNGLTDDFLGTMWNSPFGEFPMAMSIQFPALHTEGHVAQLEYLQTTYGDRVWH